ncbi:MAG: hypothetical protein F6K58_14320 [Symploca sp. SIO2E9]|nr:hypothetical protein [Symploca sp. SIO2E9]
MSEKKSGGRSKQTRRRGDAETRRRGELKFQPKFRSPLPLLLSIYVYSKLVIIGLSANIAGSGNS